MGRININLPDELHRIAKSKAGLSGLTLQDFVIKCVKTEVDENSNI